MTAYKAGLRERLFVAALALFSLATGLYRLDRYPPGPGFVESVMGLRAEALDRAPYTPYVREAQANFPSLVFYQGLAAGKALGWELKHLRLPSALWASLAVLAFYFLLRQFVSAFTAGLFALLFSVNNLHLTLARLFFPGSLLFFAAAATAAFLLIGLRRGRRHWFVLAGLACGLGLHGYVPGRMLLPGFGAWLAWSLWLGRDRRRAGEALAQGGLFVGAALLAASPVLWWAWKDPVNFWALVDHHGKGGPLASLKAYAGALPTYLAMFFSRADGIMEPTDGLALFPVLHPDWLTKLLLPVGLVLALARFWKPVPSLILGGFFLGLVPAAVAGGYPHPCTRRALLSLPFAYAAAALAWQWLSDRAAQGRFKAWLAPGLKGLAVALALAGVGLSLQQYFVRIMQRPSMRTAFNVGASLMGAEMQAFAPAQVRVSYDLAQPRSVSLIYHKDEGSRTLSQFPNFLIQPWPGPQRLKTVKSFEDFLVFDRREPHLLLLAPHLLPALPALQALFPRGQAQVFRERELADGGGVPWDLYEPSVHLIRFYIPQEDVDAFSGMVDLGPSAGGRVRTDQPGFGRDRQGQSLALGAMLAVQSVGASARFSAPWPGWTLRVDGRAAAWDRDLPLALGLHAVELRGRVPADAQGPLPWAVSSENGDSLALGRMLPLDPRQGFSVGLRTAGGADAWPVQRRQWLPVHRFSPPEGHYLPLDARLSAALRAPEPGRYALRIRPPYRGRISLGGTVVWDNHKDGLQEEASRLMGAGESLALTVECSVDAQPDHERTLIVDSLAPGQDAWTPLPADWVRAPLK